MDIFKIKLMNTVNTGGILFFAQTDQIQQTILKHPYDNSMMENQRKKIQS